jgi:hypothetical protein
LASLKKAALNRIRDVRFEVAGKTLQHVDRGALCGTR